MRSKLQVYMDIREEAPSDADAIHEVVSDAFARPQEANLVDQLRRDGELVISMIAEDNGWVLGHVALSRLKAPPGSLALAPVSVRHKAQCRGIGSSLVHAALELARRRGFNLVFVVGEPDYYGRFGFSADVAAKFPCPYAGSHFLAKALTDAEVLAVPVVYAEAFRALE